MNVSIVPNTLTYKCYQTYEVSEKYYCNFGINPKFSDKIESEYISISGVDQDNEIRIIEYPQNKFFVATLFVPQSRFTRSNPHPLIYKFVEASCNR